MKKFLKISLIITLVILVISLAGIMIFLNYVKEEVSSISVDRDKLLYQTSQINIYDIDGKLIQKSNFAGRELVQINDISENTKNAFISIEDKTFYRHNGINYKRMAKALIDNIKAGHIVEGASTITQQLVKNTHLTNEKTFKRKVKEIYLARKIEHTYTKDEILELYLNVIYFGNGCYGIEQAAKTYFGIDARHLSLDQSAMLAGIIKSPKLYNPINNYDNCIKRRDLVLKEMYKDGKIAQEEYEKSINTITEIKNEKSSDVNAQYIKCVISEACDILHTNEQNLALNNYNIYTYLDTSKQNDLYEIINNSDYYEQNSHGNVADGLAVVVNNHTGGIEAFASNSKYDLSNVKRQPGSAIKPILVYAPAIDGGYISPATQLLDEPINIDGYSPHNVGGDNHGYISASDCVAKSLNIPAVKIMQMVGIDKCKQFASKCGVEFADGDNGYAIALGGFTDGITLQQLVSTYLPFSRGGNYTNASTIRKITTSNGINIYQKNEHGTKVMGDDTAYLMTDMLMNGVKTGTSKRLNTLDYDVAGKTGTVAVKNTNYNIDAISIAYTTKYTVGATLFDYSNSPECYLESTNNGGTYATNIVKSTLQFLHKNDETNNFEVPNSVTKLSIDTTELSKNHIIAIADGSVPDRYKTEFYFANRHLPTAISDKFSNPKVDFNLQNIDDCIIVSADLDDCFEYNLYRNNVLLTNIKNVNGEYVYKDKNIEDNKMYEYHFEIINGLNNAHSTSQVKSIITKNKYDILLENEMVKKGVSWYFG